MMAIVWARVDIWITFMKGMQSSVAMLLIGQRILEKRAEEWFSSVAHD